MMKKMLLAALLSSFSFTANAAMSADLSKLIIEGKTHETMFYIKSNDINYIFALIQTIISDKPEVCALLLMQQDIYFTTQEIKRFISMAKGFGHTKIETMLRNYQEGKPFCTIVIPDAVDPTFYLNQ